MEKKLPVRHRESHYHGLLIVDKPGLQPSSVNPIATGIADTASVAGAITPPTPRLYTSHDVVQLVRRWSGQRRIGHTGTLDPMASGLLVLCLGQATRLVEYYQGHDKQYYAEVTLGSATDTYDQMGVVSAEGAVPPLTAADIEQALAAFRGEILQRPPAYSALKQGGESVHRKARRGEEVILEPRPITIHQLDLVDFTPPNQIALRVRSSAGTYIRSLAHDLGLALQTHAHLSYLRREAAGNFTLADAHTLAAIEESAQSATLDKLLQPLGYGLPMAEIRLDAEMLNRLGHGQTVVAPSPVAEAPPTGVKGMLVKGVTAEGVLAGLLHCLGHANAGEQAYLWKAEKWFANQSV
jgi:tRNA pseudouridine55 synthase